MSERRETIVIRNHDIRKTVKTHQVLLYSNYRQLAACTPSLIDETWVTFLARYKLIKPWSPATKLQNLDKYKVFEREYLRDSLGKKHTSSFSTYFCTFPKGANFACANSRASVLPQEEIVRKLNLSLTNKPLAYGAHHFLEQTSPTKWRLNKSKCKSLFFSNKSGANWSVISMAFKTLPSNAKW